MKNLLLASSLVRPYLLCIAFLSVRMMMIIRMISSYYLMVKMTPLPALPAPATTIL